MRETAFVKISATFLSDSTFKIKRPKCREMSLSHNKSTAWLLAMCARALLSPLAATAWHTVASTKTRPVLKRKRSAPSQSARSLRGHATRATAFASAFARSADRLTSSRWSFVGRLSPARSTTSSWSAVDSLSPLDLETLGCVLQPASSRARDFPVVLSIIPTAPPVDFRRNSDA